MQPKNSTDTTEKITVKSVPYVVLLEHKID